MRLETGLRRALERGEFVLHFQPQVGCASRRLAGFEALVRWNHPERGLLMPAEFIGLAEETGVIVELGRWVLGEACRQMAEWAREDPPVAGLRLAVNISGLHFRRGGLMADVRRALAETGWPAESLELEITETVLMQRTEEVDSLMEQLVEEGVKLSLDDFGTGYSSLGYLHEIPIHSIKVDRGFVARIGESGEGEGCEIVRTIVALSRVLGVSIVAEGVEFGGQRDFLCNLDCDLLQGYLFGRPAPLEEARRQWAAGWGVRF
jgi:EAL domain-containing protein (putative c-di-GMP-specific phosphodiesterase class I)